MSEGILLVFLWWFCMSIIGLVAWPLSRRFFKSFPDKGYILSKPLGLILVAFLNWILCSLHILPFTLFSCLVAVVLVAVASWFLKTDTFSEFKTFFKENSRLVLVTELLFLIGFIAFALVRMGNPDIAQTEKMPDFAFLTGIVTSDYFPPRDPWFANGTINYFYYGHYLIGFLTKLTGVATEFGYNLGVALIFALTLLTSMGITYNLVKKLWYGVIGGMFVAFIGNLDCAIQLLNSASEIMAGDKKFFPFSWYNWWMSSRVIVREGVDVTINEFPFWSYILGDLHAHMNVVPISLTVLAIILELFRSAGDGINVLGDKKDRWFRLSIAAIALGAIPCANTWDTPTYFALMVAAILLGRQFSEKTCGILSDTSQSMTVTPLQIVLSPLNDIWCRIRGKGQWSGVIYTWVMIVAVIGTALVLYLPYFNSFHPAGTDGVRWVSPEKRTLAGDFLTIYGFFFYCLIPFVIWLITPRFKALNERLKPLSLIALSAFFLVTMFIFDRFMVAFCLTALLLVLNVPLKKDDPLIRTHFFVLALVIMVFLILLGCEFVYIKDAYGDVLQRQNTIFKFYYQAWIFSALTAAYAVYWIRDKANRTFANVWEPAFRLLFLAVLMFPVIASSVKTANFRAFSNPTQYSKPTLDGMHYMSWQYKGDYKAIHWLRRNADPEERVLEAAGPAFSHYGRISAGTGMSTILGWANHENIWRDGDWKMVGARKNEVKKVYTSKNESAIRSILDKYEINYVYYGKLEREQYPDSSPASFNFMEKVMEIKDNDQKMTYLFKYKSAV